MGGPINKLTDLAIRNAKPGSAPKRIADGGGLFLEIRPNGSKYWRLAYRFNKRWSCPYKTGHRFIQNNA
jgi:hypothetical protein